MKSNVTGGIILFILGAFIITMGVSEKGKRIFNILTGESMTAPSTEEQSYIDETTETEIRSDSRTDPDWKGDSGLYGFAGEKGALALG